MQKHLEAPSLLRSLSQAAVILTAVVCLLSTPPLAAEEVPPVQWQDVTADLTVAVSSPRRSRRSPDATVLVDITNSGSEALNGEVRLLITDLQPGTVSLSGATTVPEGLAVDLSSALGDDGLAPGESLPRLSLTFAGGGRTNFTFDYAVEQAVPPEPETLEVRITSPKSLATLGASPVQVSGTIEPEEAVLTLNGIAVDHGGGVFTADVALQEGHNTVVARAVHGGQQTTDSISLSLDMTPPYITLESHQDGDTVYTGTVTITGLINDLVRGTVEAEQAAVTVNGISASISNRSYAVENVPLQEGENLISVNAVDQVGNASVLQFTLNYQLPAVRRVEVETGQSQQGTIGEVLATPLQVKVSDDGAAVAGVPVVFRVVQGSGSVAAGTDTEGRAIVVETDDQGLAATSFRLGTRVGLGNHKVRAAAVGYESGVVFNASATGQIGNKVSVNSGNNQRGAVGQVLPAPLVVVVTDLGPNVVKGARVRFEAVTGGGVFTNGEPVFETVTDSDGRANAEYRLGDLEGLDAQRVTATLLDGPPGEVIKAGFTATAFVPADPGLTTISGVVLDNQDAPVPGVTVRVEGTTRQAVADDQGRFKIEQAPVGPVHLIADGSTAAVPGEFPSLAYNLVTIPGVDNPLPAPIYMVKLNTDNAVYAGPEDAVIELDDVPGFKLEIARDSVTFPDGSREGYVSVTSVNASKVPMTPPNGMQPQFIVTIQPTGALFDPPAKLTLPNVDQHPPGAQVEMYSFDHDLEEFVAIGLGTVSEDGSIVTSNPGVGVVEAGWHCGSQPSGQGCCEGDKDCGHCYNKTGDCPSNCELVPERPAEEQIEGNCQTELCSGSEPNDGDAPPEECGTCEDGSPVVDEDKPLDEQQPDDCKELLCGGDFNPVDETSALQAKAGNECKVCQDGSPENGPDGVECGDGSAEQTCYTCKEGKCGNHCEASTQTHKFEHTAPQYVVDAISGFQKTINNTPVFNASLKPLIEVSMESGEKCCQNCETPGPQSYKKFNGTAGLEGTIQVTVPGLGGAYELPTKMLAGSYAFKGKIFITAFGAEIKLNATGQVNYTAIECPGENCGDFSLGANLNATIGPQFNGEVGLVSCSDPTDAKCEDNVTILGATGKGGLTANVKGFLGGKWSSGAQCGSSCLGGQVEPVTGTAYFSIGIEILFKKYTYSATTDPITFWGGTSFGPGC